MSTRNHLGPFQSACALSHIVSRQWPTVGLSEYTSPSLLPISVMLYSVWGHFGQQRNLNNLDEEGRQEKQVGEREPRLLYERTATIALPARSPVYEQMTGQSDSIGSMDVFILRPDPAGYSGLEDQLKKVLRTSVLRPAGLSKGGLISHCQSFDTDQGRVFVKMHTGPQATTMFSGEVAGLKAIRETGTIRVPTPITMTELPTGGAILIMRHLQMQNISRFAGALGEQLADLHLHNLTMLKKVQKQRGKVGQCPVDVQGVDKFGFHTATCCGYIPQVNEWQEDWVTFFTAQRLQPQISLIEKDYGDRTLGALWSELQLKVQNAFKDTVIAPSLLHGDFWEGNIAEDDEGPLLFDPGCFYGHSEYELSIGDMFGVHCTDFYSAYHSKIPRAPGFKTRRRLYQLFHCFNNWNHFGPEFRESTLSHMRSLLAAL